MRKLIGFIKTKEKDVKIVASEKKSAKAKKLQSPPPPEKSPNEPRELFWDGYSDIGYC